MRGPPVCPSPNSASMSERPSEKPVDMKTIQKSLFISKYRAETFPKDSNANSVDTKLIENRAHVEKQGHRCAAQFLIVKFAWNVKKNNKKKTHLRTLTAQDQISWSISQGATCWGILPFLWMLQLYKWLQVVVKIIFNCPVHRPAWHATVLWNRWSWAKPFLFTALHF